MNKIWNYEDYVAHLTHKNELVRRWAFKALETHFPNKYIDEVCVLINDEVEHLACAAPRYLATHEAVQHAPAILESFKNSKGLIPSNCAIALGTMKYEPAVDVMLEYLENIESEETCFGVFNFLGRIPREDCRSALKSAVIQIEDSFMLGSAMTNLLNHHNPEDIAIVLDKYFDLVNHDQHYDTLLKSILYSLGGSDYFRIFTEHGQNNILEKPGDVLDSIISTNSMIKPDISLLENMINSLENRQYENFVTSVMFSARGIVNSRYLKDTPDWLRESCNLDLMCLTLLEEISKRSSVWTSIKNFKEIDKDLISLIFSVYFAIKEREAYLMALSSEADVKELIQALKNTGSHLPNQIQKRILELAPITELKETLTKDLSTWGDIWTVRLMGRIGNKDFVPELIRVLQQSDFMNYIYNDALFAVNALDESADESIFASIGNKELGVWESLPILENLSYSEAYDLALERWEGVSDDDMHSYEVFAACIRGIGDPRGIKKLQEIYSNENDAVYIGKALECLSVIHNVDIPELPEILKKRKEQEQRQKAREKELNELAYNYRKKKEQGTLNTAKLIPFKKNSPKVGRNDPCPCGSGKKYKKCCLNKDN